MDAFLRWLGLEPSADVVEMAVDSSTIKRTKEQEAKGDIVNPTAIGLKGSFISSGAIGQWRKHYSEVDLVHWEKRFNAKGIDLKSFILE